MKFAALADIHGKAFALQAVLDDVAPAYHVVQTGTPNASYAILEKQKEGWGVTFRSVPYDTTEASALAAKHGRPEWARVLATGWIETPA